MRNLGFYGSDYGVKDMTIEKFHGLIESGQIKVLDAGQVISKPAVKSVICKNAERSLSLKNVLEAWVGENPMGGNGVRHLCAHNSLEASSNHFLTQLMNMSEDFPFPFGRRFLAI